MSIDLPKHLIHLFERLTRPQVDRRCYIYFNDMLLYAVQEHYFFDLKNKVINLKVDVSDLATLTVSIPYHDERWYWRRGEGWGRM